MNGKQARRIRKLLNLSKQDLTGESRVESGIKRIGIIDSTTDELSERYETTYTNLTSPVRGIYKVLKQAFKDKEHELHNELVSDLNERSRNKQP